MTDFLHSHRRPQSAADRFNIEDAQVKSGVADSCGHTCPGCHGGQACIRVAHGDDSPHAGRDTDGQLVLWIGPCDPDTHAAALAAGKEATAKATRDFLTGLDPDILRDFLDGAAR